MSLHIVARLAGQDLAVRTARQMDYEWRTEGAARLLQREFPRLPDQVAAEAPVPLRMDQAKPGFLVDVPGSEQDAVGPEDNLPVANLGGKRRHSSTRRLPMPSPRAFGSTYMRRSCPTVLDFWTRNTDPTISPSRSAIQQRSRLGSRVRMNLAAISATSASKVSSQPYS